MATIAGAGCVSAAAAVVALRVAAASAVVKANHRRCPCLQIRLRVIIGVVLRVAAVVGEAVTVGGGETQLVQGGRVAEKVLLSWNFIAD